MKKGHKIYKYKNIEIAIFNGWKVGYVNSPLIPSFGYDLYIFNNSRRFSFRFLGFGLIITFFKKIK
jgi:hypothetical protein